jgi:hypothetical protein
VPPAAHRDEKVMRPRETYRGPYVGHVGAAHNQRGVSVDRSVPHPSVLLVAAVAGTDELAPQRRPEFLDARWSIGTCSGLAKVDMLRVSTSAAPLSGTSVPPLPRDEPGRIQDHDVVAFGAYHPIPTKFSQHPYDYFPHCSHGIGQLLLTDRDDDLAHRLMPRSTLRRKVEQMSRHTLAHGCEAAARDLVYLAHHPLAELAEEGLSNSRIRCNCPANHGWPEITSSRCGAGSPSRCVTEPAGIFILTAPVKSSSTTTGGNSCRCDFNTAARTSASIGN